MRQLNRTRRRLCIGAFTVVAAPLLLASVASACTQLANLQANPNSGAAGSNIAVTGTRFRTDAASSPGPVEIRLDSRSSAPIATLPVASIAANSGGISLNVTIPASAAVGDHTLIAEQRNTSTGALLSGFPVRAAYKVTSAAASRESAADPAPVTSADPAATPAATQASPASASPVAPAAAAPAPPSAVSPGPAGQAATAAMATSAGAPTADATRTSPADPAAGSAPAATSTEPGTAASAPTLGSTSAADRSITVSSGLVASASRSSDSILPGLTFALGGAMVVLSLVAFVKSGRSVLGGRRLTSLA